MAAVDGKPAAGTSPGSDTVTGVVERSVYHDARTRYTVLRLRVEGELVLVTAVGRGDGIEDGAEVTLHGTWGVHAEHGRQFQFERMQTRMPTTLAGIRRRLTRYPGVRDVMAQRIVARFGQDTLDILDKYPRRLMEVEGVGPRTFQRIVEYHKTRVGALADLENRLVELGLSPRLGDAIMRRYGDSAQAMLEHHPYQLAREVRGIGFLTADRIARALGVDMQSTERCQAGALYALERAAQDGHCALPVERLVESAVGVLGVESERVRAAVEELRTEGALIVDDTVGDGPPLCFLQEVLSAEQNVARSLSLLAAAERPCWTVDELPADLSEGQVKAVRAIAEHGVVVLTGGPGTGKSTVMRHVIELARKHDVERFLAAPTGRAAKRLDQATGEEAKTVHRLLEIQGNSGQFGFNANNPLPVGLVVVDESSMLDVSLAESLFSALTPNHRLMLVGDAEQLPSVGPGNVLRDIIEANEGRGTAIEVVRLDKIFRQAEGSSIVRNAHLVLGGEKLAPDEGSDGEFYVVPAREPDRAHELVLRMVSSRIPEAYGFDPHHEVQVLCPMHRGRAGTEAFNRALQTLYTGENQALTVQGFGNVPARIFRLGDRVMQTRNDYDRNVFNGDIGIVTRIDEESQRLVVEVDDSPVEYGPKELAWLQLAYAISIHKSQGSEFPAVVIPILGEHQVMLRRNLLYTAMTRARKLCVLVGDPRAIDRAIWKGDAAARFTGLQSRLTQALADVLGDTRVER